MAYDPPIEKHGPLVKLAQLGDDVRLCEGEFSMGFGKISRVMTVIIQSKGVVLINAHRLSDEGEKELLALGPITDIVRITTHHSSDDLYYADKFPAIKFWAPFPLKIGGEKWKRWPREGPKYIEFSAAKPPACLPGVEVIQVPTNEESAEVVLFWPSKKTILSGDFIQSNEHGVRISSFESKGLAWFLAHLLRFPGQMRTPPITWLFVLSKDLEAVYKMHSYLMTLDWKHCIATHGGPTLDNAKEVRRANMKNWKGGF